MQGFKINRRLKEARVLLAPLLITHTLPELCNVLRDVATCGKHQNLERYPLSRAWDLIADGPDDERDRVREPRQQ